MFWQKETHRQTGNQGRAKEGLRVSKRHLDDQGCSVGRGFLRLAVQALRLLGLMTVHLLHTTSLYLPTARSHNFPTAAQKLISTWLRCRCFVTKSCWRKSPHNLITLPGSFAWESFASALQLLLFDFTLQQRPCSVLFRLYLVTLSESRQEPGRSTDAATMTKNQWDMTAKKTFFFSVLESKHTRARCQQGWLLSLRLQRCLLLVSPCGHPLCVCLSKSPFSSSHQQHWMGPCSSRPLKALSANTCSRVLRHQE